MCKCHKVANIVFTQFVLHPQIVLHCGTIPEIFLIVPSHYIYCKHLFIPVAFISTVRNSPGELGLPVDHQNSRYYLVN